MRSRSSARNRAALISIDTRTARSPPRPRKRTLHIDVFDANGHQRSIRRDYTPTPITEEVLRETRERVLGGLDTLRNYDAAQRRQQIDQLSTRIDRQLQLPTPEIVPPFESLLGAPDGSVWVQLTDTLNPADLEAQRTFGGFAVSRGRDVMGYLRPRRGLSGPGGAPRALPSRGRGRDDGHRGLCRRVGRRVRRPLSGRAGGGPSPSPSSTSTGPAAPDGGAAPGPRLTQSFPLPRPSRAPLTVHPPHGILPKAAETAVGFPILRARRWCSCRRRRGRPRGRPGDGVRRASCSFPTVQRARRFVRRPRSYCPPGARRVAAVAVARVVRRMRT